MTIVKVQLPMNDPDAPALIFAQDRRSIRLQPLDTGTRAAMAGAFKAYFEAELVNREWRLIRRVDDMGWDDT